MKVLVTGARGYIGRILTRRLIEEGHDVIALEHARISEDANRTAARRVHADIRDAGEMRPILNQVEAVCHLAGVSSARASANSSNEYHSVNVEGTRNLLRLLARQAGRPTIFIYASTALVYGVAAEHPLAESAPRRPENQYAASKAAAEEAVQEYSLAGAVAGISLRLFNVAGAAYGLGDGNSDRILPRALAVAAGREPVLPILAEGRGRHDFVHVADAVDAFRRALHVARPCSFEAFNVGASPISVRKLLAVVETVTGREIPTRDLPLTTAVPSLVAETQLIRQRLQWQPTRSIVSRIVSDAWQADLSMSRIEREAVQWDMSTI